jgi:EPS-associated MarR family transcriptional regulator
MRLLYDNPRMSQRELAAAVGISNGSAHYLLSALLSRGLIKIDNFSSSQDKRRYAYMLTPQGIAEKAAVTARFLGRKLAEYEALRREIEALQREAAEIAALPGGLRP